MFYSSQRFPNQDLRFRVGQFWDRPTLLQPKTESVLAQSLCHLFRNPAIDHSWRNTWRCAINAKPRQTHAYSLQIQQCSQRTVGAVSILRTIILSRCQPLPELWLVCPIRTLRIVSMTSNIWSTYYSMQHQLWHRLFNRAVRNCFYQKTIIHAKHIQSNDWIFRS